MRFPIRFRRNHCAGWLALLSWSMVGSAVAAVPDGPYVLPAESGWQVLSVSVDADGAHPQTQTVSVGATVQIPAVGAVPAFPVTLRPPVPDTPDAVTTAPGAPLFVVADTHGEYEILVAMLRAQGVVDASLRWKFGHGHLVVLGDVFDRGPNHLEILWLLYELEAQAARAGGGVHLVLGNHEFMVLSGDLRYLHPNYVESARVLGVGSYSDLFPPRSVLGQWLRSKPAMLKVNDLLCLHAGVSRTLLDSQLSPAEVNEVVRSSLRQGSMPGAIATLVLGSEGPLWYRGYFSGQAGFLPATPADVDATLTRFGVRRILVGHTIVPDVTPLYDGKVVAVQVYPKREDNGRAHFEALLVRKGELWQAGIDGSLRRLLKR